MRAVSERSVSAGGRRWGRRVLGASVVAAMAATMMATFASPASASIAGVTVVTATSPTTSEDKSVEANCPDGKVLVGTGAYVTYGNNVRIKDITPSSTGVEVEAFEDDDRTSSLWYVQARAICAFAPPGYEIVESQDSSGSRSREDARADCTGDNLVLGTAAEIDNISTGDVMIDTVLPTPDSVLVVANEDQDGTNENWSVSAWAICADPIVGPVIDSFVGPSTSGIKSQGAVCSSGSRTGLGGLLSGPSGQVSLSDLKPGEYHGTPMSFAQGSEDDDGTLSSWTVTAYIVCA
jgi:hypothetical protein